MISANPNIGSDGYPTAASGQMISANPYIGSDGYSTAVTSSC